MKVKPIGLLAFALTLGIAAGAQDKRSLTLQEAIELGVKNSNQLKYSQAKVDEANAAWKEASEKRLPDASIGGTYMRLNSANIYIPEKANGGTTPPQNNSVTPELNQVAFGSLNISMPVFTGGRIKCGVESAEFLRKAAALDAEGAKDQVVQITIEAFANLYKAKTAVMLMQENLVQSKERVRELSSMEKNGLLARNDLLRAELQTSNIELALVDAENNWKVANVNMNLMLGLPTATELVLDTAGVVKKDDKRVLDDYIKAATANRKDLAATDLRKKAAESGVKTVKGELFPSVQLSGGYIAADLPGLVSVTNAVNVGVGVSYNIGSLWKTKSKIKQAEARVKQASFSEQILDDNIELQVNKDYLSLISIRKKIDVLQKAVEQAEENYRIVKNKFNNSLATTTDLLDANLAQLQATLNYTLSRADAFVAYHKLLQTTGILSNEFLQ